MSTDEKAFYSEDIEALRAGLRLVEAAYPEKGLVLVIADPETGQVQRMFNNMGGNPDEVTAPIQVAILQEALALLLDDDRPDSEMLDTSKEKMT